MMTLKAQQEANYSRRFTREPTPQTAGSAGLACAVDFQSLFSGAEAYVSAIYWTSHPISRSARFQAASA